MKNRKENSEIKYCNNKQCACELPSNNKGKYCDKCRRQRAKNVKDGATSALSLVLAVVAIVPGAKKITKFIKK